MNVNLLSEDECTRFLNENNVMVPRQFKNYLLCAIPSTDKLELDKVYTFFSAVHRKLTESMSFFVWRIDFLALVW